jgi:WD40 repeat protein
VEAYPFAFSPDGSELAVSNNESSAVLLYEVATGRVRTRLAPAQVYNNNAAFSPDGRRIAFFRYPPRSLAVFDSGTGAELAQLPGAYATSFFTGIQFSRDGSTLAALDHESLPNAATVQLRSWDTRSWKENHEPKTPLLCGPGDKPAYLGPDGRTVAQDNPAASAIVLRDMVTGRQVGSLAKPADLTGRVMRISHSPDGTRLVAMMMNGPLAVWDVPSRRLLSVLRGHNPRYSPVLVAIGPDGRTVASMGMQFKPPLSLVDRLAFAIKWVSPRLARVWNYQRNMPVEVIVWDVASGRPRYVLKDKGNPVISPDGKALATAEVDGTVALWDIPAARPEAFADAP